MKSYISRAMKIQKRIEEMASCSDDENVLSRVFGTKSFIDCNQKIAAWMSGSGLQTQIDNIGNVRGKLMSNNPNARTLVIGSHYDSVINAGRYDGPLGILAGMDIAEQIIGQKKQLPFHLEIIAFSEEEGVRFSTAYMGSRAVAGNFDPHILAYKDESGIAVSTVLETMKCQSALISEDCIPEKEWLAYLEIHIEQGPVLYEKNIPVGIVSAISGQRRVEILFSGEAGHAGTVPMNMRKDALAAAAHFIVGVEEYASHERRNVVATVGKIVVPNAAGNVIAGNVFCTLDLRSPDQARLAKAYEALNILCEEICRKRNIYFEWKLVMETEPVICDESLKSLLSHSIKRKNIESVSLVSGAGHDAVIISKVAPVVMLFVKCFKGISHNPLENVEIEDIAAAIEVTDDFINRLASQYSK
ncbi:MAG: M20 family metallo-hydrolase [Ginsengibacter sp.]